MVVLLESLFLRCFCKGSIYFLISPFTPQRWLGNSYSVNCFTGTIRLWLWAWCSPCASLSTVSLKQEPRLCVVDWETVISIPTQWAEIDCGGSTSTVSSHAFCSCRNIIPPPPFFTSLRFQVSVEYFAAFKWLIVLKPLLYHLSFLLQII